MSGTVSLVVTAGPIRGRRYDFKSHDTFLFGRAPDCHARLAEADVSASRHHFLLEVNPPQARLRDLGSLNGTHVNGVRHGGRPAQVSPAEVAPGGPVAIELHDGDEIRVGATHIRVEIVAPRVCVSCRKPIAGERRAETLCEDCRRGPAPQAKRDHGAGARSPEPVASPSETDGELPPGTRVGPFRIDRLLGAGGMGVVYLARRSEQADPVALKVMLPALVLDEAAQEIFLREIEITRTLRHPNIVGLLDFGKHEGRFYFALEYCARGSAEALRRTRGGRLSLPLVLRIASETLEGLAAAHDAGFVHRDLKPDNLLLAEDGTARIADFGLAKSFQQSGLSGMTATGAIAGTFFFMPKEQLTSFRTVRPVSDVWSMAATLYHLLTGCYARDFPPAADPLAVVLRGGCVPLGHRDPSVPAALAAVIDRALEDEPERRYPTAREFVSALRSVL
jgi:pSer/pThr/pTyr-binding forkhead associated (FHA) protein